MYLLLKDKIAGIPALLIYDSEGNLVSLNGRGEIEKDHENCFELWL